MTGKPEAFGISTTDATVNLTDEAGKVAGFWELGMVNDTAGDTTVPGIKVWGKSYRGIDCGNSCSVDMLVLGMNIPSGVRMRRFRNAKANNFGSRVGSTRQNEPFPWSSWERGTLNKQI